ncbi:S1C family serine protease [Streptomyces gamaensis]|uniref:S1C family serine protease n=1 Tax=Streptomyces gamaensis TaxID=1763542 RepID=A0ABW0YTG4_9ACTN
MSTENEGAAVPPATPPARSPEPAPGGAATGPTQAGPAAPSDGPEHAAAPTAPTAPTERDAAPAPAADGTPASPAPPAAAAAPAGGTAPEQPVRADAPPQPAPVPAAPVAPPAHPAPPVPPAPVPGPEQAAHTAQFPSAPPPQPAYAQAGAPAAGAQGGWYNAAGAQHPPYGGPGGPAGGPWVVDGPGPYAPPRKRAGGLVAAVLVAALVAGGVGGGIGYWAANSRDSGGSTTISSVGDAKTGSRTPGSVADIASKALPSVVTIEAQSGGGDGGTGTGFVYDKQGHILTNNHVVASAAQGGGKLTATFSDGKQYEAEVVGRAKGYDVAVIKLKNPGDAPLNPLPLADSDKTAVGDATIAIGAPFGLSGTVTTGIVSAKKRPVASSDGGGRGNASYMSALQTDASINPGNSGGPLLNAQGAVIGINSAIQSANAGGFGQSPAGSIGLGFAIPINQAKKVADQLIRTGKPVYPAILANVDLRDSGSGARVSRDSADGSPAVTPGGPADKAGLKPGDVITKLDDVVIDSGPTLISEIWTRQPGDKVKVTYTRDGKEATTEVTLGQRTGDSS